MTRICILFFGLSLLTSCNSKEKMPAGILKPDKMEVVLWDIIKAEAFTTGFIKPDSSNPNMAAEENKKLQQQIFAIHHTSETVFYNSYDYYKKHTPVLKEMLDSMIAKASREKNLGTKNLVEE